VVLVPNGAVANVPGAKLMMGLLVVLVFVVGVFAGVTWLME
jgi:uncharacterized membrane protein